MRPKDPPDTSWVQMEEVRTPPSPWALLAFFTALIFGTAAILLLVAS